MVHIGPFNELVNSCTNELFQMAVETTAPTKLGAVRNQITIVIPYAPKVITRYR